MGRAIWWAAVCSVLIALNTNPGSAHPRKNDEANEHYYYISFPAFFKKLTDEAKSIFDSYKRLVIQTTHEGKKYFGYYKHVAEALLNRTEKHFKWLTKDLYDSINNYINDNSTDDDLGDTIRKVFKYISEIEPRRFKEELHRVIKHEELRLPEIINGLNITYNQKLNETLEIINKHSLIQKDLERFVKKKLDYFIYENYYKLSMELKRKLKKEIDRLLKHIEYRVFYHDKDSNKNDEHEFKRDFGSFLLEEAKDIIENAVDTLIDKIFGKITKEHRKIPDSGVYIDRNIEISIGDTNEIL